MLIVRVVQRRSPFTESLLTPINIWILIPITIWNTNDRWWELSFFEPRRSSRTTRTRKLNWNILNQSFRTTATNRGCLASRQRQPTPQVQKAKSSPLVFTVTHFPTCKGFQNTGSQTFSKNKELAHSTSLSRPLGSIWSTPKIRHTRKGNVGWCAKFTVSAVMISWLDLLECEVQGTRCNNKSVNKGGVGSSKAVRPHLEYVLFFDPGEKGGHVQEKS